MDSAHAVQDVLNHQGETKVGIPTPWFTLTGTIRGFRPGGFYVMAARPGIGKSALALQMAHRAEQFGHVGFFTLEMDAKEVATRLIAQESGVTLSLIEGHDPLPEFAKFKVDQWASQYQGRILFDERSNITMNEMHAQARAWTKKHGKLSMIVIDYLQLMSGPQNLSRQEFISSVTRGLKIMAKELQVPVVALSQLNRNSENRTDKRPILADLRESGSIEQDADVVFLLHRDAAPNMADTDHAALELIVAKNRQGPTENHMLSWQGEFVRAVL
jgi:replicative DNA helicase